MLIDNSNTNQFGYYIIQQVFNDVNVPRCHTENLSCENIFISLKYTFFRSGTSLPASFSTYSLKKNISVIIFY